MGRKPHHIHAGLTPARLKYLAQVIRTSRRHTVEKVYDPALDIPWGIGCLIYGRIVRAIINAMSLPENGTWLKEVQPPLQFVFSIGGYPVRFYRGYSDKPAKGNHARRSEGELLAIQLLLGFAEEPEDLVYRVVYETDPKTNFVARVFFVEMTEGGDVLGIWDIDALSDDDLPGDGDAHTPITSGDAPVVLPAATVELIKEILEKEEAELEREREGTQ